MKKNIIIYFCIVIIASMMFFPFFTMHYSTDTYRLIEMGYERYSIEYSLNDGRIFMYIIGQLADKMNININAYVVILTVLAIIISCICIIKLVEIMAKYKKKDKIIITSLISYITIMNFMYLENLYFTECIVMSISILLFILAAEYLNEKENIIKVIILVLLGVFCYQGTINVFITFYFVFALIKNKKLNKEIIKNMIIVMLISLFCIAINMLQIKICGKIYGLEQTRTGSISEIFSNIIYIIANIYIILIYSSELFPKYLFLTFLISISIITAIWDKKENNKFSNTINMLLITFVAIISSVIINIVSLSSFGLGRMVFSVGALIGLIFMYLYCTTTIFEKQTNYKYVIITILIIYVIMNILNTLNILISHKQANKLDKEETLKVNEYMLEYEQNNNIEIKNIAIAYDKNVTWCYNELKHKSLYTHRALMIWWCNVDTINYYTNRNLQNVQMKAEIYDTYFKDKDWDKLEKEQFIFEGDTMYYCVY